MEAASPAMLRLLNVAPKQTTAKRGLPTGGSMTIRADISASDGARFIREALVSLEGGNGRPYVIREWRRGTSIHQARGRIPKASRARACAFATRRQADFRIDEKAAAEGAYSSSRLPRVGHLMSACPPTAARERTSRHFAFGPEAEIPGECLSDTHFHAFRSV